MSEILTFKQYDIALIGASGFIADSLIACIKSKNISCLFIGRNRPAAIPIDDFLVCDLSNLTIKPRIPIEVGTVIFNSAMKGRYQKDSDNWALQGQINAPDFSDLFRKLNIQTKRLITIGSSEEYGAKKNAELIAESSKLAPISSYGFWKAKLYEQGSLWALKNKCIAIHLRPFNIYGVGLDTNMFIGSLITSLLKNETFRMTKGEQYRSFVAVSTLVHVVFKLIELPSWDHYQKLNALNVSDHDYYQLGDVAKAIFSLIQRGQLDVGTIPYRLDEVWHQNPSLEIVDKLLNRSNSSSFNDNINKLINHYARRTNGA